MNLIDRFKYIMKINQLTASAFANEIGVQASSVSHVLSGRNKPSLEFIQKILNRYPKVDASWLINGNPGSKHNLEFALETKESNAQADVLEPRPEKLAKVSGDKSIERILVFYSDKTFEEFQSML